MLICHQLPIISNAHQSLMCYCAHMVGTNIYHLSGNGFYLKIHQHFIWIITDQSLFIGCTAKMYDSFQIVWHKALHSALQMVLLFTLSGFFFSLSLSLHIFSFMKSSGSVFFGKGKRKSIRSAVVHRTSGLINCTFLKVTGSRGLIGCILQVSC